MTLAAVRVVLVVVVLEDTMLALLVQRILVAVVVVVGLMLAVLVVLGGQVFLSCATSLLIWLPKPSQVELLLLMVPTQFVLLQHQEVWLLHNGYRFP